MARRRPDSSSRKEPSSAPVRASDSSTMSVSRASAAWSASAGRAHVLDRIGVGMLDHLVEEALDGAREKVAHGDVELPETLVLAPFLLVLVVVPQSRQVTAERVDGAGAVLVARRAEHVA